MPHQTVTVEAEFGDDILKDKSTTHTTDVIMSVLGGLCDGQNKQMQVGFFYLDKDLNPR